MNIVYAMTRNAYEWILPSITSLVEHNPKVRVFILAEDNSLPFSLPVEAEIINVTDQTYFPKDGVNYNTPFKYVNLLKVRYPSLLPVNKVIHLDVDTIICDSLEGLWKTDLKGKWFASCQEYKSNYRPFGERYYNMGVSLINLQQMRKDGIEEQMQEYLNTVRQPWADQDAWNKYGLEQDKIVPLEDIRWNECFATGYTDNPAIVHYCGIWGWYDKYKGFRSEYLKEYKKRLGLK